VVADAVVAGTVVAGTVVAAISSDAAGKAVPAGVAGQALPEPYLPGSGDRVPAELRLVLAGYAGVACGLFAAALACATVFTFLFLWMSLPNFSLPVVDDIYIANDVQGMLFGFSFVALWGGAGAGAWVGAVKGVQALKARIRFSRLLRRPSDPRTATVTASKRGGRTLGLDTAPGGYQPLSEVRLALRTKAEILMPGERVTVYGGPGVESPVLVSSAQRSRAFLGTMKSRSTVRAESVPTLDEKVSGATLVEWAAWAASTTFSSTGRRFGYETAEVDAFRSAVRDTFLGGAVFWVSTPPVRSDDLRGKQFSTTRLRPGYDKKQVAAFLEAAGIRLAAIESADRPAGPLVSDAILVGWAEWADSTTFETAGSYDAAQVDAFREKIRDTFLGATRSPVRADNVRGKQFPSTNDDPRYDKKQVAAFLDAAGVRLAAMESTDRPQGPLVSGAIWAKWADSTRFSTSRLRVGRYDTAEVDAFREAIRDTFLRISGPPLTWRAPPGKQFTTTRRLRPGYDPEQVDAFLDEAEARLAAIRGIDPVSGTILTDEPSKPTQQDFQPPRWAEWAEWADSARFSTPRKGSGYDTAEVDAFRQEIRDTFLGVKQPPLTSDEARDRRFRMARRRGYDVQQVDPFVDEAEQRLAAMESHAAAGRGRIKITIVYESMFGNSRKVAEAISDGVRETRPEAHVECVAVRGASLELIRSTDLLIVGGPTHLGHMTTDFSRKRQISRENKAEVKGQPPHELEPETAGLGLREWFHQLPKAQVGGVLAGPHRHAAAFDTRLGSALAGGAANGIGRKLRRRGYGLVKNPEGFILDDASGPPCAGEIERAKEWGAQLVRTSVAHPEGWAIWDRLATSNE
jgi:DivIVA domain-containing protein